ncbi:corrinoid protein [Terrisporobacter vanillatitrophus]|uniref:corrinoid protein n=1 Tax=Terrisporobacter vanillatitrophus TaxID=3058402 RepID=UPI003367297A
MSSKKELLERLAKCVVEMEDEEVVDAANEYLQEGHLAFDGIMDGLVEGMNEASKLYDEEEYFVTDVLLCSDAMYAGLDVLRPHLPKEEDSQKIKGVIGVVEGDTHDIGKNLVRIMFETAGFEMHDLGRDVPLKDFVEKVKETKASLLCMSTLMTTTMGGMETVINLLKEEGIRDNVTVMIGGSPISQKYANDIGADGYSSNAVEAVRVAKELLNHKNLVQI